MLRDQHCSNVYMNVENKEKKGDMRISKRNMCEKNANEMYKLLRIEFP